MHNACTMLGLNWIDVIIILLLILAVVEGIRVGFLTQLFVTCGFFITLFAAGWLFPHLLPIHDQTLKAIINGTLVIIVASYVALRFSDIGQNIHWSFRTGKLRRNRILRKIETGLGGVPALLGALVLVWLVGVAIGRLPFAGLSNSVSDSAIIQQLTRTFPPVPAVFASFSRQVNPNSQPYVFVEAKPYKDFNYSSVEVDLAAAKAAASVVRLTSFSCGGIVSGTGFAIDSNLIATNAHVIAGSKRLIIKSNGSSYEGTPVVFDPALDLAIIRVQKLNAPALALARDLVPIDTTVAVLGYPGGNYHVAPGIIRDTRAVSAKSIYDHGALGRGIYEIQAHVDYGNSGGPAVLKTGQVAGMIFSKSADSPNHAYALTSSHLADGLTKAKASQRRVNTGACMVGQP